MPKRRTSSYLIESFPKTYRLFGVAFGRGVIDLRDSVQEGVVSYVTYRVLAVCDQRQSVKTGQHKKDKNHAAF